MGSMETLFGTAALLLGFALLTQRRIAGAIRVVALQALCVAAAAAWAGHARDAPSLYLTAAIVIALNGMIVPLALRRIAINRAIEPALGVTWTMLATAALVALSVVLAFPVAPAPLREGLALALAVLLIGLLMMATRRDAMAQVIGFLSVENGVILAAIVVPGMSLVVEAVIAMSALVAVMLFALRARCDAPGPP